MELVDCGLLSGCRPDPNCCESNYHGQFPLVELHCSPFLGREKVRESRIRSEDAIDSIRTPSWISPRSRPSLALSVAHSFLQNEGISGSLL